MRHGAYLRGNVLTGDGCVIGHASGCKTAILLDRAKAPHFVYPSASLHGTMRAGSVVFWRPGLVIRPRPGR